jgi:hypothetical protein
MTHPHTIDRSLEHLFRTGTALRSVRWLPATAALVLATSVGILHQAAGAEATHSVAEFPPPGAIGFQRRPQPGPRPESVLPEGVQPVEIRGPDGLSIAIETAAGWSPLRTGPLRLGLVVGQAYRLRVGGIAGHEGVELFPSIRPLARLDVPPGMAWRFPLEVVIDEDDLRIAAEGAHVRRIVYLACESDRPDVVPAGWFDVRPGDDALDVASTLGQPVAELVIGNRLPATDATR